MPSLNPDGFEVAREGTCQGGQGRFVSESAPLSEFFGINWSPLCVCVVQVQCTRVRLESQLSGLLQTKYQAAATRNGSVQGMDIENPVHAIGRITRRRSSGQLSIR